ncbi:MAG: hypothetical protein ACI9MC_001702, partial [Kiritimatiellia bacterium]
PKFHGGWALGSPALGDVTGDGYLELVQTTREGHIFVWQTLGRADGPIHWPSFRHDPQNTGNHSAPLLVQEGPSAGCCRKDPKADGSFAAALILPLLWLFRRRKLRGQDVRR